MSAGKTEEEAKNKSDYSGSPRYATKMGIWWWIGTIAHESMVYDGLLPHIKI
jgi:hypothetical protein